MKLKSKIFIDKLCGSPIVLFLNFISHIFLLFKQEKKQDNSKIKRIAISKFMGMGSIIQSTPLLRTIRDDFPGAEIIFITLPKNYALLSTFPFIDKIVIINDKSIAILVITVLKMIFLQWIWRIDIFIDLEVHSYFSTILTALCFPRFKYGFYKKESQIQTGIYSKMVYYNTKAPVHKIYLQIAHLLKCKYLAEDLYDWGRDSKGLHDSPASKLFSSMDNPEAGYIVINPNASDLRIERRWDKVNFIDVINRILCDYSGLNVVLTGSTEEQEYTSMIYKGIKEEFRGRVADSSGQLTMKELIVLIDGCAYMVTNDSGPMHIAFALKKNTVALFGPCSPQDYNTNRNVSFVYKNLYCSPCVHHFTISPCRGDNQCMKLISPNEVMKAVKDVIGRESRWSSSSTENRVLYGSETGELSFGIIGRK